MKRIAIVVALLASTGTACASARIVDGSPSGVRGTVLLGPLCPVQRQDSPCPDRPIAAAVTATDASGKVVATAHSGQDGRFSLGLVPGSYVLAAASGQGIGGGGKTVDVVVSQGRFAQVTLRVDTGIR
jgi:hypothetical protein